MTSHHLVNGNSRLVTYVLRLADGNFYVGITTQLHERLKRHWNNRGSRWTKKHKPYILVGVASGDHEESLYKRCVELHGKDRVRGWTYTNV